MSDIRHLTMNRSLEDIVDDQYQSLDMRDQISPDNKSVINWNDNDRYRNNLPKRLEQ